MNQISLALTTLGKQTRLRLKGLGFFTRFFYAALAQQYCF